MHTNRPLKSADRPVGLAYNKPQLDRETIPLCLEKITHDRWVLQSIAWYQLELTQTPYMANSPKGSRAQERSTITGDQRTPDQECNCGNPAVHK